MVIKTLVENNTLSEEYSCEHGLSLYIEVQGYKILFDVGATGLFLENAKKLGISIEEIDLLVISHGHYDHGGGLKKFLEVNKKAKIYLHPLAFEKHYSLRSNNKMEFIGIDQEIKDNNQIVFTSQEFIINERFQIFSKIDKKEGGQALNNSLYMDVNGEKVKDSFEHEQNLIIEEEGKSILLTGCAHNGIINIVEHFYKLKGYMPDYIIGGFHLSSRSAKSTVDNNKIEDIAKYLLNTKAKCYTCHCTGIEAYEKLKDIMKDSIDYIKTSSEIII